MLGSFVGPNIRTSPLVGIGASSDVVLIHLSPCRAIAPLVTRSAAAVPAIHNWEEPATCLLEVLDDTDKHRLETAERIVRMVERLASDSNIMITNDELWQRNMRRGTSSWHRMKEMKRRVDVRDVKRS